LAESFNKPVQSFPRSFLFSLQHRNTDTSNLSEKMGRRCNIVIWEYSKTPIGNIETKNDFLKNEMFRKLHRRMQLGNKQLWNTTPSYYCITIYIVVPVYIDFSWTDTRSLLFPTKIYIAESW
jgi:hypothetical protein